MPHSIAPFTVLCNDKSAVVPIAEHLCAALAGEAEEFRESAHRGLLELTAYGLKDGDAAHPVVDVLVPALLTRISHAADKNALTHLTTILTKFGALCVTSHDALQAGLFALYVHGMDAMLEVSVTRCCCALISAGTRSLVATMITAAFEQLSRGVTIFGEVIAKLTKSAGRRVGPLAAEMASKLIGLMDAGEDDAAPERQASVLSALTAIISNCPKQCKGADFTAQALEKASELLVLTEDDDELFDFGSDSGGSDDGSDDGDDGDSDGGDETDDNDDFDDEDDLTWKVRAAAAKCVAAVGLLPGTDAGPEVVMLLIDRVENESSMPVKIQIYFACQALLCRSGTPETVAAFVDKMVSTDFARKTTARAYALAALRSLAIEQGECLVSTAGVLCPGLCTVLGSTKSELRAAASELIHFLIPPSLSGEQRGALAVHVSSLASALESCVQGSDGRVQVSALDSIAALAGVCTDETQASTLFDLASGLLTADSNTVVDAAICTTSRIVVLHGSMGAIVPKAQSFVERLQDFLDSDDTSMNSVRMAATDAVGIMASESSASSVIAESTGPLSNKLVAFLSAQEDRMQRRRTVSALAALGEMNAAGVDATSILPVVAPLVGPADIQLSAQVLHLCGSLLGSTPAIGPEIKRLLWPATFELLNNPSLNESARNHVVGFCVAVVKANTPDFGFEFAYKACASRVEGKKVSSVNSDTDIARHTLKSLGACIGAMSAAASLSLAERFVAGLDQGKQVSADQHWTCEDTAIGSVVFALRGLGALGAEVDLSETAHFEAVLECLDKHSSAEIRNAATDCLTSMCRGNADAFAPKILAPLRDGSNPGLQARVLQAIRALAEQVGAKLDRSRFIPVIFEAAVSQMGNAELRQGVGQCLGNMMNDEATIAQMTAKVGADSITSVAECQIILTAMQNAVRAGVVFDMGPFVALVDREDLGVKEAALSLLSSAIRSNPQVALPVIDTVLLQKVYTCAQFYADLVDAIHIGCIAPILKDSGLGVRRAAFEVLEALAFDEGSIAEVVEGDMQNFIAATVQGLDPCGIITVNILYVVGADNVENVSVKPANDKTQTPAQPGPGHAAFVDERVTEIAAMAGVDPKHIEETEVAKEAAKDTVKFKFKFRLPNPSEAIAAVKKSVEDGKGTAVPTTAPVTELVSSLDVSDIQEVALVAVRCNHLTFPPTFAGVACTAGEAKCSPAILPYCTSYYTNGVWTGYACR